MGMQREINGEQTGKKERESIKENLNAELADVDFTRAADVLRRTHPRTWQQRFTAWWNRELSLPIIPIGIGFVLLLFLVGVVQLRDYADLPRSSHHGNELVQAGGNTYWKKDYERAVAMLEGDAKG